MYSVFYLSRCPCPTQMPSMASIMASTGASSPLARTSPATWPKGETGATHIRIKCIRQQMWSIINLCFHYRLHWFGHGGRPTSESLEPLHQALTSGHRGNKVMQINCTRWSALIWNVGKTELRIQNLLYSGSDLNFTLLLSWKRKVWRSGQTGILHL